MDFQVFERGAMIYRYPQYLLHSHTQAALGLLIFPIHGSRLSLFHFVCPTFLLVLRFVQTYKTRFVFYIVISNLFFS
jgi:hypothetical protein